MWYALVQDEQLGPMSAKDLGDLFTQGVINLETFIWQDGMPEWLPLNQVDAFQEITQGAVADLGLYDYSAEDDEDDDEGATLMIPAGGADDWSDYLEQLKAGDAPAMASTPPAQEPAPSAPPEPVAEVTEAVASPFAELHGDAPSPFQAALPPVPSAFEQADQPQGPLAFPDANPHFDAPDLAAPLEFGADFSSPPVPSPAVPEAGSGKLILMLVALLLIGAGGAGLFMYLNRPVTEPVRTPGTVTNSPPSTPETAAPPILDAAVPDAAVPDAAAPVDAAVPDADLEDAWIIETIEIGEDAGAPKIVQGKPTRKYTAEEVAQRKEARKQRLAAARAAQEKKRLAQARSKQPKTLGRKDIEAVVKAHADRIGSCAKLDEKAKGYASVAMTIARNGSVTRAKIVTARLRRSPAGKCLEKVVKGLKFPKFSGDPMRINLPLKL
jgi:hypothetical protein